MVKEATEDTKRTKIKVNHKTVIGWGYRHQQCFILFCSLTIAYSMRACMGVTLVAMTGSIHSDPLEDLSVNNSSNFTSRVNGTKHGIYGDNDNKISALENEGETSGLLLMPPYPLFKWNKKVQDTIQSSFFWGYMILQIPAGQLVHIFGARYLLSGALFANCLMSILSPWAAYYGGWMLIAGCRFMQGLSQACVVPGVHTFLGKWAPLEERGRLSGFVFGGQAIGTALGLPITGFIASSSLGWPGIFRFYGILSGFAGGLLLWLSADTPAGHKKISDAERRYIEEGLGQRHSKKPRAVPWKKILRCRGLYAIIVAHIAGTWGHLTLYTEVPAFMDKVMGVNIKANGLLTALPFLMMWLSSFFFNWFTDMLIVKKVLSVGNTRKVANSVGSTSAAVGLIVLAYVPKNIYVVETILVLICTFKVATHVGYHINHIDISPNYSGTLMSITNFMSNLFGSLAPMVAGLILTDVSDEILWRKVFFVAAGLYLTTNIVYVVFGTGKKAEWDDPDYEEVKETKPDEAMEMMIKQ